MPSLSDVLTPQSADDIEAIILGILQGVGFPVTSWQPGSVPRTLIRAFSEVIADLTTTISDIAAGGYLDLAEGIWLDLLALSQFDLLRNPALFTEGLATLTDAANAGPYTITVGQLFIQDAAGHRYTNITAGTLPQGLTLQLTWRAEAAGVDYNVDNGVINQLVTVLPGVTVNNPDPGTGNWITSVGADVETDALLRQRCRDRWATLGTGGNIAAYRGWAIEGSPTVTRVTVDAANPGGPGTVFVYLANSTGGATPQEVLDADALIQERKALTANVTTFAASNLNTTITATVDVLAAYADAAQAAYLTLIPQYRTELAIGSTVYRAQLIEILMTPQGAVNVPSFTTPATDVLAAANQVHTFTPVITVNPV